MRGSVRYISWSLLLLIIFSTISGAVYEMISRCRAANEFPVIGKLVDIGGRRIQLDCRGVGRPTVVFKSGLDLNGSLSWSAVHDQIAKTTRACAYSRAGIMWSRRQRESSKWENRRGGPASRIVQCQRKGTVRAGRTFYGRPIHNDLHGILWSGSGGMVCVDASHPDQVERFEAITSLPTTSVVASIARAGAALTWTGITRGIVMPFLEKSAREYWRLRQWPSDAVLAYSTTSLRLDSDEIDAFDKSLAEAGTARQLNDRPVFVLTGMGPISAEVLRISN